jgi:Domain of unknown function (DUF4159)/Aerotolerance regulator N-terminal
MWTIGSFAFAAPWMLLAIAGLPLLWWLLRLTPPAPKRLQFPAIRLLLDLLPREETPHQTPLWLIIFRMLLAAILIIALAHPLINPVRQFQATGPVLLVVDDGWAAAPRWPQRLEAMTDLVDRADREGRSVLLLTTAPRADGQPIAVSGLMTATQARGVVQALQPQPWGTDRKAARAALDRIEAAEPVNSVWISDGTVTRKDDPGTDLAARLQELGPVTVIRDIADNLPLLLLPPPHEPGALEMRLARPSGGAERTVAVRAIADDGRLVARQDVTFAAGRAKAEERVVLPTELRNRMARLVIESESSAGATVLFDEGWRRRPVGVIVGTAQGEEQPLLGNTYYVERALAPFNEIRHGDVETLLQGKLAVLVLADIGNLTQAQIDQLAAWVDRGGVLIRFAGTWLAQKTDPLLPVRLRGTDRAMGGAMSWAQPLRLAPFPNAGPFAGLAVPPDVTVRRQVLAEPDIDLGDKTWARLTDGTPLVTGARQGQGWVALVHTTANADWSSLALSGLFVEMLQRLAELSEGFVETGAEDALPPLETLDGFGRLTAPPAIAVAATPAVIAIGAAEPRHPPGYYGRGNMRRALNISTGITTYTTLGSMPLGVTEAGFARSPESDLKPWLLALVAAMLVADMLIALALRGLLGLRRATRLAGVALLLLMPATLHAQDADPNGDPDAFAIAATAETRLAYVKTGLPELDATSRAGLAGLTYVLNDRTAVETGSPIGVDVESDELAFFPLLYWPISGDQPALSDYAIGRINGYLRGGGTILFDTLDQNSGRSGFDGPGIRRLRDLARGLDIPPLMQVPLDHVLTKSFYLLQDFPGRWADGAVWVERSDEHVNDGVSSVIIGGNDWASAWAVDSDGRPMFAVVPGGEHQREMAYRFGVNLVMYALTGNYKSDQVHVPFILERLGQ